MPLSQRKTHTRMEVILAISNEIILLDYVVPRIDF